jgi:ankyrin repeat protein
MDDNFAIIKALINAGANVHVKDDHNRSGNPMTPVLSAAILHKWKALTLLVAHHAEVKGEDDDGNTALILAAESADEEVVRLLLQQGVRVNAMNKRDLTAVGYAVAHNRIGVVRLLIDWGADVKYDGSGLLASAPIEVAAREGNDDMVRLLLAHGAKVDQRYEGSEDGVGVSALAVASMHHHRSTVDLLLAHGADINACARFGTALTFAAEGGDLSLVRFLVARGANVNARDAYRTVLEAAVEHPDVVRYLLRHGAEVDKPGRPGNWDITPLNRAAIVGAVGSIRVLLEYGADINRPAGDGDTPLMTAARAGHQEVVKTLIQSGADINLQTHHREAGGDELSALDIAEQEKKDAVVRLLRQAGAQE